MKTILIIGVLFCIYKILTSASANRKEAERDRKEAQRQAEATRMRNEWRTVQAEAKVAIMKQEAEWKKAAKEREELFREQERVRKEQERQKKEQERQAAQLAKHEDQLAKLEYESRQARRDIDHLKERLAQQYAMMDSYLLRQSKMEPGTREFDALQKQIIVLDNQMHQTRKQYSKAAFVVNDYLRKSKRESA